MRYVFRGQGQIDVPGRLKCIETYDGSEYLSTTLLVHYCYSSPNQNQGRDVPPYNLNQMKLAAIPNGLLQERYNPDATKGFWRAGRDAPSLGEGFRVRLSFNDLQMQSSWRIQTITYNHQQRQIGGQWNI